MRATRTTMRGPFILPRKITLTTLGSSVPAMIDIKKEFLCVSCNYEDEAEAFGKSIVCPRCHGVDIVLAAIWRRFRREDSGPPAVGAPSAPALSMLTAQGSRV